MNTAKPQLFYIHGGMTFKTHNEYLTYLKERDVSIEPKKRWSGEYLHNALEDYCHIIKPRMPASDNAKYKEWKIVFESYFPLLEDGIILVGTSLGGIFLTKYLSEHTFPKTIRSLYLIAPPYDNSLPDEDLVGGFELQDDLSLLEKNSDKITFFFSKDDSIVPESQMKGYQSKIKNATFIMLNNKNGHFDVEEFPELIEKIKDDVINI